MAKDKVQSLTKYVAEMKSKLADPVPAKHADKPDGGKAYRAFLQKEVDYHQRKLDGYKLTNEPSKK